ncbi:hypothetical protein ACLB2K_075482 [Fragaria x ananassa]
MAKRIRMEDSVVDVPNKRRRMESSVAERVVQQELLPRDVQFQILSRLPVKPLMRCKLVCKSWSSRIRDPLFARAHQTIHKNQHTTNLFLTTCNPHTKEPNNLFSIQVKHNESGNLTSTPPVHLGSTSYLMGSPFSTSTFVLSAGVVCHYSDDDEPVHIFNPCTREVLTIPMQRSSNRVSLGFSSLTNEYKVLRGRKSPFKSYKLEILSLGGGGGTWRDLPEIDYQELGLVPNLLDFSKYYLCIHGALHWIQPATNNRPTLLAFDVGQEIFRVIPFPLNENRSWGLRLIQVNGCLAVFDVDVQEYSTEMDFWILKDYQNQVWFKDSIIFPERRNDLGLPRPVGSIHTGELLLTACKKGHGFVHLYDMKLKTYNKTEIVLPEGSVISAAGYDETIFPLKQ